MVEKDTTTNVSISLYNSQITKVEKFLRNNKRFRSVASFFQFLVDDFFEHENNWKTTFKNIMVYLGYPLIFMTIMLYVGRSTDSIGQILYQEGLLVVEIGELANIYYIIGFGFLGITIASVSILFIKLRKR